MDAHSALRTIDIANLPELATWVGMPGGLRHVEVGGQACIEQGIIISTVISGALI